MTSRHQHSRYEGRKQSYNQQNSRRCAKLFKNLRHSGSLAPQNASSQGPRAANSACADPTRGIAKLLRGFRASTWLDSMFARVKHFADIAKSIRDAAPAGILLGLGDNLKIFLTADLFTQQRLQSTPWKSKPSWYILCLQDHTVHPDLQRCVSKRMGATVIEVESSHVPMLSKPEVVIDVIRQAAKAIQGNKTA